MMSDPANENAGAPAAPAIAAPEAPTAGDATPPAGASPGPPRQSWYRRRWAVVTGAVAAAVILFLGGVAVGTAIGGGHDRFGRDGRNAMPGGGQGFGHEGWGDSGSGQGMMPGQGGNGWDQDGDHFGQGYGQPQAPGATQAPVPSQPTSPQALTQ
jgi:hypothetical protein